LLVVRLCAVLLVGIEGLQQQAQEGRVMRRQVAGRGVIVGMDAAA